MVSPKSTVAPRVALALTVVGVVALATDDLHLLRGAATWSGWTTYGVRAVAAAVLAFGVVLLVRERRAIRGAGAGPDPTVVAMKTAFAAMAIVTFVAFQTRPPPDSGRSSAGSAGAATERAASGPGAGRRSAAPTVGATSPLRGTRDLAPGSSALLPTALNDGVTGGASVARRVARSLSLFFLLAAAILFLRLLARRGRPPAEGADPPFELAEPTVRPSLASAGLDASLDRLDEPVGDPRDGIAVAYRRLLTALAAAGAPKRPHEAPHEHLHRTLGALGVRREPLHRLAALYVLAEFGDRPIHDEHRSAAAASLRACLEQLRHLRPTATPTSGRALLGRDSGQPPEAMA